MGQKGTENTVNTLKNIDFIAWQISRIKRSIHRDEVNRIFNGRTRLRSNNHVN